MKEINGEEIYGIEDVRYSEEAWCEHCMELEPFDATVEMGTNWCMDCARYDDSFQLSEDEKKAIAIQELAYKFKYFSNRFKDVADLLGEKIGVADENVLKLLHSMESLESLEDISE